MNKFDWVEEKNVEGWNSACGRFSIVRRPDEFNGGHYFELSWLGAYGQTCRREYGTQSDAKRAASMRSRATEVCA